MRTRPKYNPSWQVKFALFGMTVLYLTVGWALVFGQEVQGVNVQKHYRLFVLDSVSVPDVTIRSEYHLMVGTERSASLFFGGVEGEPQPRVIAVVVGNNEFREDGTLCFLIDEIAESTPQEVLGVTACFTYDPEADTMAPINDPGNLVLEDCGDDHTRRPADAPGVSRT